MAPVVAVQNVSKKYARDPNAHLSYGMRDLWNELTGRPREQNLAQDEFWAIRGINFSLNAGDSLALVGRNGSGKSTLLKVMNGLLKPDVGSVTMRGRVQALINLGAGFSPSSSGLENIINSASLLGISGRQVRNLVDEIVNFAELEEFIESPVQTYSSGMKARLGFSVAIHLSPDILLIDEILSVGDFAFQNKCYMKLQELKKAGTTIVLVSHSHTQILQLCQSAIWIHRGQQRAAGAAQDVVESYLRFLDDEQRSKAEKEKKKTEPVAKPKESLYGPVHPPQGVTQPEVEVYFNGKQSNSAFVHDQLEIRYRFTLLKEVDQLNVSINICREDGLLISTINTLKKRLLLDVHTGEVACSCIIEDFDVVPGKYVVVMPVQDGVSYLFRGPVAELVVTGGGEIFWGIKDFAHRYIVNMPVAEGDQSSPREINS